MQHCNQMRICANNDIKKQFRKKQCLKDIFTKDAANIYSQEYEITSAHTLDVVFQQQNKNYEHFLDKNHMNMYSKYPEHISRLSLRQFRNYSERSISNCANLNQSQIVRQHPDIWERVCIDALSLYQMWQYVPNSRNLSWYSDY